ncbi:MAG TPA: AAA family ATPase [Candidatus Babeliales bacterium]|nr:AAA family ATPase [Candidatus Babeliales bacterium]
MRTLLFAGLMACAPCLGNISINGNNYLLVAPQQIKPSDGYVGKMPQKIKQLLEYIKNPQKFHNLGIIPSTTFLLVGPPGSGKTSMVKSLAESTNSIFIRAIGSDFVDQFVGVGARRVREIFQEARDEIAKGQGRKVIIFIDEIDAIGSRDKMHSDDIESARTVNALLAEVEEANHNPSFIIVGATNFIDKVDKALLRPGRFDATIRIGLPELSKRIEILKLYTQNYNLSADVNLDVLGQYTEGFTPADIEFLSRDAGLTALNTNLDSVTQDCFIQAINNMLQSLQNRGDENAGMKIDALACAMGNGKKGFQALAGEIPSQIMEIHDFIKNPKAYEYYGIAAPKGVLIAGPHGTGKTALVRALAQELGCELFYMAGTEFVEQYFGMGAKKMRSLFERARSMKESNPQGRALIFIDEIDVIGSAAQRSEYQQTLSELLIQMDGFKEDDSVIVFGATSYPQQLSPTLLSFGRFDIHVNLALPDNDKRFAILESLCENKPMGDSKESIVECLSELTNGYDIAQLKSLINNAARRAMSLKSETITLDMFKPFLQETIARGHQDRV